MSSTKVRHNPKLSVLFGQRIRELRLQRGLTSQEQLAELAGVHRTFIGRVERGETKYYAW